MTVSPGKYVDRCAELLVEHYGAFAPIDAENRARRLRSEGEAEASAVWWRIKHATHRLLQERLDRPSSTWQVLPVDAPRDHRPVAGPVLFEQDKQIA